MTVTREIRDKRKTFPVRNSLTLLFKSRECLASIGLFVVALKGSTQVTLTSGFIVELGSYSNAVNYEGRRAIHLLGKSK